MKHKSDDSFVSYEQTFAECKLLFGESCFVKRYLSISLPEPRSLYKPSELLHWLRPDESDALSDKLDVRKTVGSSKRFSRDDEEEESRRSEDSTDRFVDRIRYMRVLRDPAILDSRHRHSRSADLLCVESSRSAFELNNTARNRDNLA